MTTYYYLLYILCRMRPRRRRSHARACPPRTPTSGTPVALAASAWMARLCNAKYCPLAAMQATACFRNTPCAAISESYGE